MKAEEFREIPLRFSNEAQQNLKVHGFPNTDNTITSSKYTLLTFIPKNLFEQFRRMVNFFFLCLIIIQVSIDIPVSPIPYALAFLFVIGVTGVKQGYEDWCRHKSDKKVNFAPVHVIGPSGKIVDINSKDIKVGQIIRLEQDEPVPCDILLIACTSKSGAVQSYCQITTANLDGESNHKMRFCPPELGNVMDSETTILLVKDLEKYMLRYDQPNSDLYKFSGQITSPNMEKPINLTMENILLRGSSVKNCGSIYGISIYTGKDTRLSKNSNTAKTSKFSTIEHTMNKIVIGMFILLLIISSASVGLSFMYKNSKFEGSWYIPQTEDSNGKMGVTMFFSYLVLLCYLIPVSLSVSFELQKLGCSKFFAWDDEMVCEATGNRPICNTSDLNEELGQVEYLFTDKTGTLTDNDLIFRCCSINGTRYEYDQIKGQLQPVGVDNKNVFPNEKSDSEVDSEGISRFLKALAICHTVRLLPDHDDNDNSSALEEREFHYQASSLDEEVLVKVAHRLGVKFLGEENKCLTIDIFGTAKNFKLLATLEFDSDRKRMSVIVGNEDGQYFLFCKGAESSILPKCKDYLPADQDLIKGTEKSVTDFAKMGYRTLAIAFKELEQSKVEYFQSQFENLRNKPEELQKLYSEVESDLTILGCTGVEDKLQDGVPETLRLLKGAGIKILMLTGDKLETAISVASSCGLLDETFQNSNLAVVADIEDSEAVEVKLKDIKDEMQQGKILTLVIDGQIFAIGMEKCLDILRYVVIHASSVVFCRMAPLQKAQAVNLIKQNPKKNFKTCAVGDGGNDCAMLREAHLGIGIMGKEGLQAARESDFAIGRFKFLQKAILVHGYWYYHRLATLITYFFYRGVVFIFQIFLYGFDIGFTAGTIFDSTFVMMFTISFTSVPVLIQGLTEQPYSKEQLLNNTSTYKDLKGNELMSFRKCFRWILVGLWHIAICYYIPRYVWAEGLAVDDYGVFSFFISSILVLITDTKIVIETRYFTWLTFAGQIFSYSTMVAFYSLISQVGTSTQGSLRFSYYPLFQQTEFWLTMILVGILSVVPDLSVFAVQSLIRPKTHKRMEINNDEDNSQQHVEIKRKVMLNK